MKVKAGKRSRPTIGLLIGQIEERYQALVWPGVADVAREQDANLICFVGRALESHYWFDIQRNVIYDLAGPENVDGLVIMSGTLGNYVGIEALTAFCQRYRPLPMASIALAMEGVPSVLVDNEQGMRQALTHLIEVHGHRRIAFIRGPERHQEAEERYKAYADVLAEHGIPLDADLVAPGDFVAGTGTAAVHTLLDERGVKFEALVASDDNMAIGAMEALQARGLHVPNDVGIVGFDDIEEVKYITPPITTVRQPLRAQGRRAAELVLAQIAGDETPMQVTLPTELIVRHSCGCLPQAVLQAAVERAAIREPGPRAGRDDRRESILAGMIEAVEAPLHDSERRGIEQLLDAFLADLDDESSNTFLRILADLLDQVVTGEGNPMRWHEFLSALRRCALPTTHSDQSLCRAENLWQQARVLAGEAAQRSQVHWRLRAEGESWAYSEVNEALMTSFDVVHLVDTMARELPRLRIRRCYLSLYEPDSQGEQKMPTEWSRLILAFDEDGRAELQEGERHFPSRQLVPKDLLPIRKRYDLIVEALHFREQQFGFALFELVRGRRPAYEMLSRQISTALKGALLAQERSQAEETLKKYSEHLEEMVETRTRELRQAQEALMRREKLAVLGQLAGGVAHELRNPLGLIKGSAYLLDMMLEEPTPEAKEALGILIKGIAKSEKIISSLLGFARSEPAIPQQIDVNQTIQEALSEISIPKNVRLSCRLDDPLPRVIADPDQLGLALGNLILNAIQAMPKGGELVIETSISTAEQPEADVPRWAVIRIADTGVGIPKENLQHLFEPLFTTKPGGIGLGLAIVKAVIDRHEGTIKVESKAGKGSTFVIRLPLSSSQSDT